MAKVPTKPAIRSSVASLRDMPRCSVLVIGGGINGIATFRDLALQGVDVILVERADYCSGASAASSHMIHGGIRYLENGEFRLVRESVQERNWLLGAAPHYVKPLQTTVPIFSTFSGIVSAPLRFLTHKAGKPNERGALLIKIGLTLYDSFSRGGGKVARHRFRGRKKSLARLPKLNSGVKYTATYFDASVHDPERLALDVLADALEAGAHARSSNYVESIGATKDGVRVRDVISGTEFTIAADVVVNTTGPWTDETNHGLGAPSTFMGGTKGSHIVVDNQELHDACAGGEVFFENDDGRIVLIFPLKGRVMIGTTDLEADLSVDSVCTEQEIDYFIELVSQVFPTIALNRSQIVFSFSGVRPLPKHDDMQPGFVSRDYRIERGALAGSPLLSLVGGKWTTFRALAAHLAQDALDILGRERSVDTTGVPIGGGKAYPTSDAQRADWLRANATSSVDEKRTQQLLERYGTRAGAFIATIGAQPDTALRNTAVVTRRELVHICEREHVVHLDDLVLRRTSLAFTGELTADLLTELAEVVGGVVGWSKTDREAEVARTRGILLSRHRVAL